MISMLASVFPAISLQSLIVFPAIRGSGVRW